MGTEDYIQMTGTQLIYQGELTNVSKITSLQRNFTDSDFFIIQITLYKAEAWYC